MMFVRDSIQCLAKLRNPRRMPFTSIPHSTHLFTDFLYHFPKVQEFYRIPRVECRLDSHHNGIKSVRRPVLTIHVLKKRDNCLSRAGSGERGCLSKTLLPSNEGDIACSRARTLWKSHFGAAQSSTAGKTVEPGESRRFFGAVNFGPIERPTHHGY